MKSVIQFFVERALVINLISVFILVLGVYTVLNINREHFPNVNLDKIVISTIYPGASPEEIEKLINTPIEQELKSLDGIDKMNSVAFPSTGTVSLELDPDSRSRSRIVSDIQLAIDRIDLPDDLPDKPLVLEIDGRIFPIVQLALSASRSQLAVKRLGDDIADDLLAIEGVAKIQLQGSRKVELRVEVIPDKLSKQHLSIGDVDRVLKTWNIDAPGGDIETPDGQRTLRISGQFKSVADAENLVLRANDTGNVVRLKDIANVTEELEKATEYYDIGDKPALNMMVMKHPSADIIDTVARVKEYLKTVQGKHGADVKISLYQDFSRFAKLRLGVLTNNAIFGLVMVFMCLILFLRPSVALTTTMGLPIVFLIGLFVIYSLGITLNLVSMLGFIMVLGMLVDDAIIVGENITYHMEQRMPPLQAAVVGAYELLGPVTATVLTTVAAFIPMFFMGGTIGKFIYSIPVVVITLLLFSLLESFLILPNHVAHFTNKNKHPKERAWLVKLEDFYGGVITRAVDHRILTTTLSLIILFGSIGLAATKMRFELFPSEGVEQFIIRATADEGISLKEMQTKMHKVYASLKTDLSEDKLETILIETGKTAIDNGDALIQRGSRYAQLRIVYIATVLRPNHNATDEVRYALDKVREKFKDTIFALQPLKPGPPTGRELQVEIIADKNATSERVANRLLNYLQTVKGVETIESDIQGGDKEYNIVLDRQKAIYAGIDLVTVSRHIRAIGSGLIVSTIRRGDEEIDVTIRYPDNRSENLNYIKNVLIPNNRGGLIPLNKIATIVETRGYSAVRHAEGLRVIRVLANVNPKLLTSSEINSRVASDEEIWLADDKKNVKIKYGGENEKNQESMRDLAIAFGFALIGIFFILSIQFNNLGYPLAVMLAIPFGAVGIIVSFYLHDIFWKPMPLSFFSMLGMVALTGVVVNNSLILLVFIQRAVQKGMQVREAIILAGRRRIRAVLLTAMTTVVGLLPTAYGWGGMDPFVSPMALSLSWGLIFATLVTLITIPAIIAIAMRAEKQ